ncbi:hypothetical protein LEP1GSC193_1241 [Leptospira alstonii serovar Pingchang str. 80-412]|uniref:Uncharacterized protein n=2 Tax=Leptospira alstonii TaxID=28452 RepID=M6DAK5_9LEPT|nr:hypothetical protein LEP1GSC194_0907 [Leptospira alstonii serovar Sichuan str. 79601]EQA82627.1 hypothetical protein LEP1GSC193_1241 [Leptospira alstonii serovar Pingchang str. 80-412]
MGSRHENRTFLLQPRERSRWKYCNAPFKIETIRTKNETIVILEKYKMALCRLKPRARPGGVKQRDFAGTRPPILGLYKMPGF